MSMDPCVNDLNIPDPSKFICVQVTKGAKDKFWNINLMSGEVVHK